MPLHIIYTETDMLLSKRPYTSWREIQDAFESYKTSLGPWERGEVIEYLSDEHPTLFPSACEQVEAFLADTALAKALTFRRPRPAA